MKRSTNTSDDPAVRTLEHELDLVRTSIAMVASGAAPRVVLGNLCFGEKLIRPARRMAFGSGVCVVPIWTTDEAGADLAFERMTDD